ncbi:hypothetical protein NL676_011800 [Syzygium grande]|nr:hypothetical protein NL676_011800 [Syzygium grande]
MIGRRAYWGRAVEGPASGPAEGGGASSQPRRCKAGRVWVLARASRGVGEGDDVNREFDFASLLGRPAKITTLVNLSPMTFSSEGSSCHQLSDPDSTPPTLRHFPAAHLAMVIQR